MDKLKKYLDKKKSLFRVCKAVRVSLFRIVGKKHKNPEHFLFAVTGGGGRGEGEGGGWDHLWELTPDTVRWRYILYTD